MRNMFVSDTHREPTNEELGIRPYPKRYTYPTFVIVGVALWYLILTAF